jgi:hypothetical protein
MRTNENTDGISMQFVSEHAFKANTYKSESKFFGVLESSKIYEFNLLNRSCHNIVDLQGALMLNNFGFFPQRVFRSFVLFGWLESSS